MHLLADRGFGLWNGDEPMTNMNNKSNNAVQVRQPISHGIEGLMPMHQPSRADNLQMGNPPPQAQLTQTRSNQNNISLEQSMQGGMMAESFEPSAANEGGGGFAMF
jgi:hypothetical protein